MKTLERQQHARGQDESSPADSTAAGGQRGRWLNLGGRNNKGALVEHRSPRTKKIPRKKLDVSEFIAKERAGPSVNTRYDHQMLANLNGDERERPEDWALPWVFKFKVVGHGSRDLVQYVMDHLDPDSPVNHRGQLDMGTYPCSSEEQGQHLFLKAKGKGKVKIASPIESASKRKLTHEEASEEAREEAPTFSFLVRRHIESERDRIHRIIF
uniref:Uncharacterized protein n=1 Tax=Oryza brachyantha TaxID=4533 RepID=J3KUX2_ORYBR